MRRFQAKLRKIRWRIYQKIRFKKKRLKRTFDNYKKEVNIFLKQFSSKLKLKETSIWSEKLTKTSNDVLAFLNDAKKVGKVKIKAQPCFECSNKLDSVLFMLSTVLHLVRTDQAKAVATGKEASKTSSEAAEQSVEQGGDNVEESNCEMGAITTAAREAVEAPTKEHESVVDKYNGLVFDDLLFEIDPASKGLRNSVYNDPEEHMRRVREASNQYLANCGKLGKVCPAGIHKGYAISECKHMERLHQEKKGD